MVPFLVRRTKKTKKLPWHTCTYHDTYYTCTNGTQVYRGAYTHVRTNITVSQKQLEIQALRCNVPMVRTMVRTRVRTMVHTRGYSRIPRYVYVLEYHFFFWYHGTNGILYVYVVRTYHLVPWFSSTMVAIAIDAL